MIFQQKTIDNVIKTDVQKDLEVEAALKAYREQKQTIEENINTSQKK